MSKAMAALVRLGLEGQESRKRELLRKLETNLANDDPGQQDQMADEFRGLIPIDIRQLDVVREQSQSRGE